MLPSTGSGWRGAFLELVAVLLGFFYLVGKDHSVVGEVVDHGQGVDVVAAVAEFFAAALEDLFDGDTDAGYLGSALFAEVG